MEHFEGWNSLEMNQRLRALHPDIIINNRSLLPEDFGTPEEHISAVEGDWEACMTFNGISWGYVDSAQAAAYSYNANGILRMLFQVTTNGGNLLLNIGPAPDGGIPTEALAPLETVGRWLAQNGEAAYGTVTRTEKHGYRYASGVNTVSCKGGKVYLWNWIWPNDGEMIIGGFTTPLKSAKILSTGEDIQFAQEKYRIKLHNLPKTSPDPTCGVAVIALDFGAEPPEFTAFAARPQLNHGRVFA
jgi:alpha-L-fucosidase